MVSSLFLCEYSGFSFLFALGVERRDSTSEMLGLQYSEIMIFWMSCSPIPPHVHPFPELHMTIPMSLDTPGGQNKSAKVPSHRSEGQVQGGWVVGGQGQLRGVKLKLKPWFLWT